MTRPVGTDNPAALSGDQVDEILRLMAKAVEPSQQSEAEKEANRRDWFALAALPAIITATSAGQHQPEMREGEERILPAIARDAYAMADALLLARKEDGNG